MMGNKTAALGADPSIPPQNTAVGEFSLDVGHTELLFIPPLLHLLRETTNHITLIVTRQHKVCLTPTASKLAGKELFLSIISNSRSLQIDLQIFE